MSGIKKEVPTFIGKSDPDAYLKWDQIRRRKCKLHALNLRSMP